jgi:cytochrome c556
MKKWVRIAAAVALATGVCVLSGHGDEPKKDESIMQKKLKNSQVILEGIAVNDFDKIAKHADELIDLSNQAEWKVLTTPQYEIYSNDFRRTADALVKSAKEKNIDACALNYVELTLDCVKCHKYFRETRRVRDDGTPPVVVAER